MSTTEETPISPIGQTSREAAGRRYQRDERYRAAHDRLAPYRVIARAVILARAARHVTQRDLASMLGTTDTAISRIESGERAISLETLRKLGAALDIVFLVGSTAAVAIAAADPRTVVVPEAPIEPKPVQLGHGAVKLARRGELALPAVPALRIRAGPGG